MYVCVYIYIYGNTGEQVPQGISVYTLILHTHAPGEKAQA